MQKAAREQRVSPTKLGVHGEVTAVKNGRLRRETTKLNHEIHCLEKERDLRLKKLKQSSDKESCDLVQMFQEMGKSNTSASGMVLQGSGTSHPTLHKMKNGEVLATEIFDIGATCNLDIPKERKLSRRRLDELSRPKPEIPPVDSSSLKVMRRKKSFVKMVSDKELIDVTKSPAGSPVSSPSITRSRKKPITSNSPPNVDMLSKNRPEISPGVGRQPKSEDLQRLANSPTTRKLSTSSSDSGISSITTRRKNSSGLLSKSYSVDSPVGSPPSSMSSSPRGSTSYEPCHGISSPKNAIRTQKSTPRSNSPTESHASLTNTPRRRRVSAYAAPISMLQQRAENQRLVMARYRKISADPSQAPSFHRERRISRGVHICDGLELDSIVTQVKQTITKDLDQCRYLRIPKYLDPNIRSVELDDVFN